MTRILAIACVAALVLASGFLWLAPTSGTVVTAYFDKTIGLYAGSAVRVLGVKVGSIDSVTPVGGQVKVKFTVDSGVRIPADVHAVVIAPSLVSDRYVQLTPAYDGGPELAPNATLNRDRTASPVELDQLFTSVDQLSQALGPSGANKNGALSNVIDSAAANLAGTTPSSSSARPPARWTPARATCSAPWTTSARSPRRWRPATSRCTTSTVGSPTPPASSPTTGSSSAPRCRRWRPR
jgi:virulence factor Mce-like protein